MESALLPLKPLTEFGPNPFSAGEVPAVTQVHGPKPRTLKAGVLANCENIPGVYGFLDKDGVLAYVGKSKQLRTRLLSYFSPKSRSKKQSWMIRQTRGLLFEPATSEFAALLRELQLIQHWRPRFNIKDIPHGAQSTYLCLGRPTAPGVFLTSKPAAHVLATFGPIWISQDLGRAVEGIYRMFLLRDCPNSQSMAFADQSPLMETSVRPGCLRFDMQNCLGPCVGACSQDEYHKKVKQARRFLEGGNTRALNPLVRRMHAAAQNKNYELAARLRDDLTAIEQLRNRLERVRKAQENYHFVYPINSQTGESTWYLIRGGRVAAVTKPPHQTATAKAVRELLEETYSPNGIPEDLTAQRPDTLLLVTSWFQQHEEEHAQTLSPAEAKKQCNHPRGPR